MKSLHKIANVLLSITLLIATTGFTLNKHYCMGRLKAVAINESANLCSDKGAEPMPCCEDVSQELKVEELTKASFDFDSQPDLVEVAFIAMIVSDLVSFRQESTSAPDHFYNPPPPDIDFQVDHQLFLI